MYQYKNIIKFFQLIILAVLFILSSFVFASAEISTNDFSQLSEDQFETLIEIKNSFNEIDLQINTKSLSKAQAEGARIYILNHHRNRMEQPLATEKLRLLALSCMQDERCREKSIKGRFDGVFNFINIMWFIASLLILAGIISVLVSYKKIVLRILAKIKRLIFKLWQPVGSALSTIFSVVLPAAVKFFKSISVLFYEFLSLFLTLMVIYLAQFSTDSSQVYIAFIGNGLFMLVNSLLFHRHRKSIREYYTEYMRYLPIKPTTLLMMLNSLVLTASALFYQSQLLGFFIIALLLTWLGFGIVITSLTYSFGFRGRSNIVRGTLGAFVLLATYVLVSIFELRIPNYSIFEPGIKYLGSFVFYTGLLISSSKWVCRHYHFNFWLLQGITITAGIAALYLGSVYELYVLRGIGGTFFALYIIEKQFDFRWRKKRLAWMLLILGLLLFAIAQIVTTYPQYFFMSVNEIDI